MRKLLLPSFLILAGLVALAGAQQITKSVQLSQDPTGLIGFDTNNDVYLPGPHLLFTYGSSPTIFGAAATTQSCGGSTETTAPTISGSDTTGLITTGSTGNTSCSIAFNKAWNSVPWCMVAPETGVLASLSWVARTNDLVITMTSTASGKLIYWCTSLS